LFDASLPNVTLSNISLSEDRTTATGRGWARGEQGFPPECGIVRWRVQLGSDSGGNVHMVGVVLASDERPFAESFSTYLSKSSNLCFFQDDAVWRNGTKCEGYFSPQCMKEGDVVLLELERGASESVLRINVDGRPAKEMCGLPSDGVLHPVVHLLNSKQSYTLLPPLDA
jgi:hypothetical protein